MDVYRESSYYLSCFSVFCFLIVLFLYVEGISVILRIISVGFSFIILLLYVLVLIVSYFTCFLKR